MKPKTMEGKECEVCDNKATGLYRIKMGGYSKIYHLCKKHRRDNSIRPFVLEKIKESPTISPNNPLWELYET